MIATALVASVLMVPDVPAAAPADLVITAGTVITLDGARPRAAAVAVRGGRIVAVGTAAEIQPLIGRDTRRIDLPGATVVPGLGDAHVHVESIGDALENIDLRPTPPEAESSATARGARPACWSTPRWRSCPRRSRPPRATRGSAGSRRACARARRPA